MIESMTGYGRGQATAHEIEATVEIRSVNNRFCDVIVHLPRFISELEIEIQQRTKKAVERGKVTVSVRVDLPVNGPGNTQVNEEAARQGIRLLEKVREITGLTEPISMDNLLSFSEIFVKEQIEDASELSREAVSAALDQALAALCRMRRDEGRSLESDVRDRLASMNALLAEVEARGPHRVTQMSTKLRERVASLDLDGKVDEQRIAMEIALLSDRLDITEECVRLRSHIELFLEAVGSEESTGRRLNFLAQEMNREINTIGAKANDTEISHTVVSLKEELEKIREQVQNIQ